MIGRELGNRSHGGFVLTSLVVLVIIIVVILMMNSPSFFNFTAEFESDYSPRYYELLYQSSRTPEELIELDKERCEGELRMLLEINQKTPQHYPEFKRKFDESCV